MSISCEILQQQSGKRQRSILHTIRSLSSNCKNNWCTGKCRIDGVKQFMILHAGSGSLLLKVADEAPKVNVTIYGQEIDVATRAMAKMNMCTS